MICWNEDLLKDEEKKKAFVELAVRPGTILVAHPKTARRLNNAFRDEGVPLTVRENLGVDQDMVYAVAMPSLFSFGKEALPWT